MSQNMGLDIKITPLCAPELIFKAYYNTVAAILEICHFNTFPLQGFFGTFFWPLLGSLCNYW